jgi:hypothetical protein
MGARVAYLAALLAAAICLVSCALRPFQSERRAAWRGDVEATCLGNGELRASAYVRPLPVIDGPSACGLQHPLSVSGALDGAVAIEPPATIDCSMTVALNRWLRTSVQRAAYAHFRQPVVAIRQIASYDCRTRDSIAGAKISEHAFGNALDVAAFRLANGREIKVLQGWWRGSPSERAFLQEAFAGACAEFYTVLGPGSDRYHSNHFHLDLLLTNAGGGRHYCRPMPGPGRSFDRVPTASLPDAPQRSADAPLLSFTGR